MSMTSDFISLLSNTTNSYKYLFLKSILNRVHQGEKTILIKDIVVDQLIYAWYPNQYFKLSFGLQDKISDVFKEQHFEYSSITAITSSNFESQLRSEIVREIDTEALSRLLVYVPFRLLSPFFGEQLQGKPDHIKNNMISELSYQTYDIRRPLYRINKVNQSVEVHSEWSNFIMQHHHLLKAYLESEWVKYLQKHNPNVPAISFKTAPPINRGDLKSQKNYWDSFLNASPNTACIYTGQPLNTLDISIDHFLPWSFVCHDRIWNLIPTSKSINSSKGNALPCLERYLDTFIETQHLALCFNANHNKSWNKISYEVMHDLGITDSVQLFDDVIFEKELSQVIKAQFAVAEKLGFRNNWSVN